MLLARSLLLRCGLAVAILGVLLLATYEHGLWGHVQLRIGALLSSSEPKYQSTVLKGLDTGKGSKIVVMGKMTKDNTTWVQTELPDWQSAIYTVDDPLAPLHTPLNKGREAMPYLTFIIDNYAHLPETILFQHSHHNRAWHVSDNPGHDNAVSAQRLRLPYIQASGYVNLRCIHNPGCHGEVQPFRDPPILNYDDDGKLKGRVEMYVAETLRYMFGDEVEVPREIGVACCAQFAVSRDRVRERERGVYERIRRWVVETELDDYHSGRVMEYLWHIIFGMPAVYCPSMRACNCNLYGMCDDVDVTK